MASFNSVNSTLENNNLDVTMGLTQAVETATAGLFLALNGNIETEDIEQAKQTLTKIEEKKKKITERDRKMQSLEIAIRNAKRDKSEITGLRKEDTNARTKIQDKINDRTTEQTNIASTYVNIIINHPTAGLNIAGVPPRPATPAVSTSTNIEEEINKLENIASNYKNIIGIESYTNENDTNLKREPGTARTISQQAFTSPPPPAIILGSPPAHTTYTITNHSPPGPNPITLTDIEVEGKFYSSVIISNVSIDSVTGQITLGAGATISPPEITGSIPITTIASIPIVSTAKDGTEAIDRINYSKIIHLATNEKKEDTNILREPQEFIMSGRVGQDLRFDRHFYGRNGLPGATHFDVFNTYPGGTLNPPSDPGNRSVLYNIEVDGITYQEIRVQTDINVAGGVSNLQIQEVQYVDRSGELQDLEEGNVSIELPIRGDFNGETVDKTLNLTLDLNPSNPLPPGLEEAFEVNLHNDLPRPSADMSFSHEGYNFDFTKAHGWTVQQNGEDIYGTSMFDIAQYTGGMADTGSVIAGLRTGIQEGDNKRRKAAKAARWGAKAFSGVGLGYEILKKGGKRSTNALINTMKLRNKMNRSMRREMGPEAMNALYHGYFSYEYRMLDPNRPVEIEANGFYYHIENREITVFDAGGNQIVEESVTSEAGQQLIWGESSQKLGVGYALTMAMRGDNRAERTIGDRAGDLFENFTNIGKRATPSHE